MFILLIIQIQVKKFMRETAHKQQAERLDSLLKANKKSDDKKVGETAQPSNPPFLQPTKPSKGEKSGTKWSDDTSLVKEFSYQIARGEVKQVKKKIMKVVSFFKSKVIYFYFLKMLSKQSSRNELFGSVDSSGQNMLHLCADGIPELIPVLVGKKMDINKGEQMTLNLPQFENNFGFLYP